MSASDRAMPGGQPSMTQPMAGPCDSPKLVTVNKRPRVLPAMTRDPDQSMTQKRIVPHAGGFMAATKNARAARALHAHQLKPGSAQSLALAPAVSLPGQARAVAVDQ